MAKKEEKSNKHEGGKETKDHPQKHEENRGQGSVKEGGPGKGHANDTGFDNFEEGGKGKFDDRGFQKVNDMEKGNLEQRNFGNDNQSANENAGGLDLGNIGGTDLGSLGGTGLGNPDLSTSLGKLAKNKGCLSSATGLFILLALILIL